MKQIFVLICCLGFSSLGHAEYFPARQIAELKNVSVLTENGVPQKLADLIAKDKTLLLVPGYYSCTSACPLVIENIQRALGKTLNADQWQILFLSFNEADQGNNVKIFRTHHRVPEHWLLTTIQSEASAKELLEAFNYRFQKTQNGYDHPNAAYVFSSKNKKWSGIIAGTSPLPGDFKRALQDADLADRDDSWIQLQRSALHPTSLIIYGFIVIALCFGLALLAVTRKHENNFS